MACKHKCSSDDIKDDIMNQVRGSQKVAVSYIVYYFDILYKSLYGLLCD